MPFQSNKIIKKNPKNLHRYNMEYTAMNQLKLLDNIEFICIKLKHYKLYKITIITEVIYYMYKY